MWSVWPYELGSSFCSVWATHGATSALLPLSLFSVPRQQTVLLLCLVTSMEVMLRSPSSQPLQTLNPFFSPFSNPGKNLDCPKLSQITHRWTRLLYNREEVVRVPQHTGLAAGGHPFP